MDAIIILLFGGILAIAADRLFFRQRVNTLADRMFAAELDISNLEDHTGYRDRDTPKPDTDPDLDVPIVDSDTLADRAYRTVPTSKDES